MDREHSLTARARGLLFVGVGLPLAALACWLLFRGDGEPAPRTGVAPPPVEPPAPSAQPPVAVDAPPPASASPAMQVAAPPPLQAPAEPDAGLPHPHPITPEHQRIQLENQYIQALNDAMDLRDGAKLRRLAARYRAEKFADVDRLGEGYELVASCLEQPGPASRAAAQAFFDRERGSILRRHVRRHCLE